MNETPAPPVELNCMLGLGILQFNPVQAPGLKDLELDTPASYVVNHQGLMHKTGPDMGLFAPVWPPEMSQGEDIYPVSLGVGRCELPIISI